MSYLQGKRPKSEAARIEKVIDTETLLTTGRDLLKLRDWYTPKVTGEDARQATKRAISLLSVKFQGKIIRYLNMGTDAQKRILAANVEVIEPPPASADAVMEKDARNASE